MFTPWSSQVRALFLLLLFRFYSSAIFHFWVPQLPPNIFLCSFPFLSQHRWSIPHTPAVSPPCCWLAGWLIDIRFVLFAGFSWDWLKIMWFLLIYLFFVSYYFLIFKISNYFAWCLWFQSDAILSDYLDFYSQIFNRYWLSLIDYRRVLISLSCYLILECCDFFSKLICLFLDSIVYVSLQIFCFSSAKVYS